MINSVTGLNPVNRELLDGSDLNTDPMDGAEDFSALLVFMLIAPARQNAPDTGSVDAAPAINNCAQGACIPGASPIGQVEKLTASSLDVIQTVPQAISESALSFDSNNNDNNTEGVASGFVGQLTPDVARDEGIPGARAIFEAIKTDLEPNKTDRGRNPVNFPSALAARSSDSQPVAPLILASNNASSSINSQEPSATDDLHQRVGDDQTQRRNGVVRSGSDFVVQTGRRAEKETEHLQDAADIPSEIRTGLQSRDTTDPSRSIVVDATFSGSPQQNRGDPELPTREHKIELTQFLATPATVVHKNDEVITKNESTAAAPARIINDVAEQIAVQVRHKQSEAVITLDPPDLGSLRIALKLEGDKVQVRIIAELHESGNLIHSHLPELTEALRAQRLDLVDVHIDSGNWNSAHADVNGQSLADSGQQRQWRGERQAGPPPANSAVSAPSQARFMSAGRLSRWA